MTKWSKKVKGHPRDPGYRPGEHGYGQLTRSYQRYNATLGCFEEVPRPGTLGGGGGGGGGSGSGGGSGAGGGELRHESAPPRKSRMKVMIKPYTNEAGEVVAMPPSLPAPLPQQRVARYEEVVEEDGQVVVHVPDSAAGPDGIIRLLQVTNEDGSVHYISADQTDMVAEGFSVEDAMEMILTEGGQTADPVAAVTQHIAMQNIHTEPPAAAEQQQPQQQQPQQQQHHHHDEPPAKTQAGDAAADGPMEILDACYVCGQPAEEREVSAAGVPLLTPLMSGHSRHSATPLAELLADTVQRELTVSTADGVCAACLTLLDQCDQEGPLRKSATRHVRNVLAVRVGDLSVGDAADTRRKRGRQSRIGRPTRNGQSAHPAAAAAAAADPEWAPVLDVRGSGHMSRVSRPWSPTQEKPKLEHLTDLTVPSETKRSARIAIRKNAYVANAVHASNRPQVLVVPDLQSKYLADPRPQRRPYRRLNMTPAKGRRGRPKLPNPPENEPSQVVTMDGEIAEKPPDVEPGAVYVAQPEPESGPAAPQPQAPSEPAREPNTPLGAESDAGEDDPGRLFVEANGVSQVAEDGKREAAESVKKDEQLLCVEVQEGDQVEEEEEDDEEEEEQQPPRQPEPGCPCIMCTELTQEERAILAEEAGFRTTYLCQVCGEELVGRARYRRHERNCKLRQLHPRRPALIHECNTCHLTFKSARLRDEHYTLSGHEKRSPCPVCHRFFHPDFLRIHLSSHSGAFLCRVCNTHFSSKATLRGHMYRHSGLKPHKCDVCAVAFRTPSSLFMHKRYHHSGERPYVCNVCQKGFAARSTLRIHLRQHTGERPFACKLCTKSYTRKSSLTQHLRSHTQERRHACMTCGKRFDNKTYLKVHMNRHLGIRAHPCGRCGRGFYSRPNLLKHMQVLCYKEDYGRPEAEQQRRTEELQAAQQQQRRQQQQRQQQQLAAQHVVQDHHELQMHAVKLEDDDIQTTEVILAIESIPEDGELLVGHMVP